MTKLIFIRHSQTKQDPNVSSHTWTLTETGRERCLKLAEALHTYGITRIITSEEQKAILTGKLTAEQLDVSWQTAPDLGETKRETIPYFPELADFKNAIRKAMAEPDKLLFGEETFTSARERFAIQVDTLLKQYPDDTLAIATHGTILSLYLAHISSDNVYTIWESLGLPAYIVINTDTSTIEEIINIE